MQGVIRNVTVCAALFVALALGGPAVSAQGPGGAGEFVKKLGDKAIQALTVEGLSAAERENRFRGLLREGFDVKRIGRFVLGRYSRNMQPVDLNEYQSLFEDLIVATYAARFAEYSGQQFVIKQVAKPKGRRDAIVLSEIQPSDGGPVIRVDWQVQGGDSGDYKIVDVRVEGVSMSITQREEFTTVIRKNGGKVESLIAELRKKSASLKSKQ